MRRLKLGLLLITVLLALAWIASLPALAQEQPQGQVIDLQSEYTFGGEITFQGLLQSEDPPSGAALFLRSEGQTDIAVIPATIGKGGRIQAVYNLAEQPLRAFSQVTYWFQVTFTNAGTLTSPEASFHYEDNRFPWQNLPGESFQVYWYNGDLSFAQEILNIAQTGLQRARDFLPLDPAEDIKIYAYDSPQEIQAALLLSGQSWVAGHAHPDLKVILVSLPPGPEQHLEMERQVPHELMHILLYQANPAAYDRLPTWFNEGLASITELYPNPDYQILLKSAYQKGSLLPFNSLCQVFPRDANGALLAYAQAASFTRFLYRQTGTPGLEALQAQFAAGLDCERGVEQALGSTLARLENQWRRETFAENLWMTALEVLLPWFILLVAILVGPLLFSTGLFRKKTANSISE